MNDRKKTSQLHVDTDEIRIADAIKEGIELCQAGDWKTGVELMFKAARHESDEKPEMPARYYSYLGYGIAQTQNQLDEGVRLCLHGARLGLKDPECWFNLAQVYAMRDERGKTVAAISRGLALAPKHRGLRALQARIGMRRRPVLPFLSRANPINRWLGRRRHERELERLVRKEDRS